MEVKSNTILLLFLSSLLFALTSCEQNPTDPKAYPIQIQAITSFNKSVSKVQLDDWDGDNTHDVVIAFFKAGIGRYYYRATNMEGSNLSGVNSEYTFWENPSGIVAYDTIGFDWLPMSFVARTNRCLGAYQYLTATRAGVNLFDQFASSERQRIIPVLELRKPYRSVDSSWYASFGAFTYRKTIGDRYEYSIISREGPYNNLQHRLFIFDSIDPPLLRFQFLSGCPLNNTLPVDFDGDGKCEYLLSTGADNSDNEYNGTNSSYGNLVALNNNGSIRWIHRGDRGAGSTKPTWIPSITERVVYVQNIMNHGDSLYSVITELDPDSGKVILQRRIQGIVTIQSSGNVNRERFAIVADRKTSSVYFLNNNYNRSTQPIFYQNLQHAELSPILIKTTDVTFYQIVCGIGYFLADRDLQPISFSPLRINEGKTELPIWQGGESPKTGHAKPQGLNGKNTFVALDRDGLYHVAILKNNHLWWFWRYRRPLLYGSLIPITGIAAWLLAALRKKRLQHREAVTRIIKLRTQLVETRERTHLAISRDLHDTILQDLAILRIQTSKLKDDGKIVEFSDQLKNVIDKLRRICRELFPSGFVDSGICEILSLYIQNFSSSTGLEIEFRHSCSEEVIIPLSVKSTAYRAVREALTNVKKHAEATKVVITLAITESILRLSVVDNGKGFEVMQMKTLGLFGIEEDVKQLNGNFLVRSTPGSGTRLTVQIPIHLESEE